MADKPAFPKISLKYPNLESFSRAARKCFEKGRLTVKLKRDIEPRQKVLLVFSLGDRENPVEIIGQVMDRVPAREGQGSNYGISFLNFSEKKLNRLIAGEDLKPVSAPAQPAEAAPQASPAAAPRPVQVEFKPAASAPRLAEPEKTAPVEKAPAPDEEEVVLISSGPRQSFDLRPAPAPEEPVKAAEPATSSPAETKVEPEPEPAPEAETKPEPEPEPAAEPETKIEHEPELAPNLEMDTETAGEPRIKVVPPQAAPAVSVAGAKPGPEPEVIPMPDEDEVFEAPEIVDGEPAEVLNVPSAAAEAAPAPPAKPVELKPVAPKFLADFLFRFCKMVLNPPDPTLPDASKNFVALFQDFQNMMESRDRLAIYLAIQQSGKDFIIEGILPAAKSIRVVLPPDLSGTLIFRMIEVFDQKELLGIIFRKFVDLEHFKNFILNLGQFNPEKETSDALALRLIYQGIYHLNLIFETDLVAVPEKIEEETKIILARFSGELKRLRSFASQVSEDPLAMLTLRLEDIIKFVVNPLVVAQVLEHLPLVWRQQVEEFDFDEFEDQILFSIPIPLLLGTFEIFIRKIKTVEKSAAQSSKQKEEALTRLQRVLRRVMARIAYEAPERALSPLADLFSKNIIKYEELPGEIRNQVAASMLAREFLKEPEKQLKFLDAISAAKAYAEASGQMIWAAIALIETEQKDWANQIFQKLVAHYQDKQPPFPERPGLAREALKKIAEPTAVEILLRALAGGKKEHRELAAAMLYAAGESAAKRLIKLLETSADRNVRRMICEVLFRYGEKVAPVVSEELDKPEIPWYLARNLLLVFSEIKSPLARERAKTMLKHPHPRVREEALSYLFAINEEGIDKLVGDLLQAPESSVRRRALGCLARMEKISDLTLMRVLALVRDSASGAPDPDKDVYFPQAVEILSRADIARTPEGHTLDEFLVELLKQTEKGLFSRAKSDLSPKMKVALIEALGRRKAPEAEKILSKLVKDKDELVRKSAQRSLDQIG